MRISQDELTLEALAVRLAELEHANTQIHEELSALRAEHSHLSEPKPPHLPESPLKRPQSTPSATAPGKRKSRRTLLRQGLGAAVAAVGAGTLMEASAMQALASTGPHRHGVGPDDNPGNFSSSNGNIPAVTATGSNGADGIDASSDSGTGVYATSSTGIGVWGISSSSDGVYGQSNNTGVLGIGTGASGYGVRAYSSGSNAVYASSVSGEALYAQSNSNNAIHAVGSSGVSAVLAEGGSGTGVTASGGLYGVSASGGGYGVYATSSSIGVSGYSSGGIGVYGQSDSHIAVSAYTNSGTGISAQSSSGTALAVTGTITVSGNAVGQATLPAGKKSVKVTTPAATTSSNVVLTALNGYKGTVWVTRASGSFTINSSVAQTSNVGFTYLIIN